MASCWHVAAWRGLDDYVSNALPRPGSGVADLHVILAQAVMGDDAGLKVRANQLEKMARQDRYPSGSYLPALAPGFLSSAVILTVRSMRLSPSKTSASAAAARITT